MDVAARQAGHLAVVGGHAQLGLRILGGQPLLDRPPVDAEPLAGHFEVAEGHVLGDGEAGHDRVGHRVLGDADGTGGEGGPGPAFQQLDARHQHRSVRRRAQAHGHLVQLPLPVARHTGHAHQLAAVDGEVDAGQGQVATVALHRHPPQLEGRGGRFAGGGTGLGQGGDGASHHGADQLPVVEGGGVDAAEDDLAAPQHRDPVGDGASFVQLVGDDDHREAAGPQLTETGEEGVDLLGGEHAGGLVEDDELGPRHQHLEDLHPLALADGQVADEGRGVAGQPVAGGGLVDLAGQSGPVEAEAPAGQGEGDVLGHGQRRHQAQVLEHHADAEVTGDGGRVDAHRRAGEAHLARVGSVDAVDQLHEGALAGPVLPQQGVDLARPHLEVDRVVGHHLPEAAGHVPDREQGLGVGRADRNLGEGHDGTSSGRGV